MSMVVPKFLERLRVITRTTALCIPLNWSRTAGTAVIKKKAESAMISILIDFFIPLDFVCTKVKNSLK